MKKSLLFIFACAGLFSCHSGNTPVTTTADSSKTPADTLAASTNTTLEFSDSLGHKISAEELRKSTGTFNYEIYGMEGVPQSAISLHKQARLLGVQGQYQKAIAVLEKAHQQAPKWPYPVYDIAYTYLLLNDNVNALKYYRMTDELAPKGFFTSKTALFTLEQEKAGKLEEGLYKLYVSLEWIDDEAKKREMCKHLTERFPTYAPAWKEYSGLLDGTPREKAIDKGLSLESDMETRGILLINKALVLNLKGDAKGAKKILLKVIFDPQSTNANVELAKYTLSTITGSK